MSTGKPILFIDIIQEKFEGRDVPKFEITPEAIQFLSSLGDKQVAVLTIAGPQRSGKSFLANRILKQMKGFEIGPSTNPCTKGIWLWNQPVVLNEKTVMLVMDTEGLNSVQRDQTIDMQIFSISILLSSMFIYNNLGHIDELAIENLALVVKLSENICVKQLGEDDSLLGQFSPNFYWILRDFSLDLKGKSPKEYLESVLKQIPGDSKELQSKNEIREKLRAFFPQRDCQCLVRPLAQENLLRKIEEQEWESLRPEFRQGVIDFENKVFKEIPIKKVKNAIITGSMFLNLTLEYLNAINTGGIPTILNSLERVVSSEVRKISEELKMLYKKQINIIYPNEKMPFDEDEMALKQRDIQIYLKDQLEKRIKGFIDPEKLIELQKDMFDYLEKEYRIRLENNKAVSKSKCNNMLQQLFQAFLQPNINTVEEIRPQIVKEKKQQFLELMKEYFLNAKGFYKMRVIAEKAPQFLFDYFDVYVEKLKALYTEDHNRTKTILQYSKEGEERLRATIQEYEKLTEETQKTSTEYQNKYEEAKNEAETMQKRHAFQINKHLLRIQTLEAQIEEREMDISQIRTELGESEVNLRKIKHDENFQQTDIHLLQQKLEEMEKLVNRQSSQVQEDQVSDLYMTYRELRQLAGNIKEWLQKKNVTKNSSLFIEEIEKMKDEKCEYMKKFHEDLKAKKLEFKNQLSEAQKYNDKRLRVMQDQMDELKTKSMEMSKRLEQLDKKDQQIKNLLNENTQLHQQLSQKISTLETHTLVLEQQRKEIEKMCEIRMELEQKCASFKSDCLNLKSLFETYPYLLKESLKYVMNKPHKLKHSMKNFTQEDLLNIYEAFSQVGIDIKAQLKI